MPDILDASGLQIKTAAEIRASLEAGLRQIYGADINLDQNSPDGQLVGILTQLGIDIRELVLETYNSFNPDRAIGVQLDERVTINNIERAGGTFTTLNIDITVNQTVTLQGLDAAFNDLDGVGYTVQDNAGTQFILIDTVTLTAGVHSLAFRAREIGKVETIVGTINAPVTIVIGVVGINNGSAPTNIGQDQELDAQLRLRRSRSVANASNGYLNGLLGTVLSLNGVTEAALFENFTNVTDSNGIPPHAIWLIVEGGANADIGNAIYEKKSYGANMRGDVTVNIPTASGGVFVVKFDRPDSVDLHVRFDIKKTLVTHVFDEAYIKTYMVNNLTYEIGEFAETATLTAVTSLAIAGQGGNGIPINMEISNDGVTWVDYLEVPTLDSKWTLDVSRITITVV